MSEWISRARAELAAFPPVAHSEFWDPFWSGLLGRLTDQEEKWYLTPKGTLARPPPFLYAEMLGSAPDAATPQGPPGSQTCPPASHACACPRGAVFRDSAHSVRSQTHVRTVIENT